MKHNITYIFLSFLIGVLSVLLFLMFYPDYKPDKTIEPSKLIETYDRDLEDSLFYLTKYGFIRGVEIKRLGIKKKD